MLSATAAAFLVAFPSPASAWENDLGEVTLFESGGLSQRTRTAVDTIGQVLGVQPTVMQSGTIRMRSVVRGDRAVQVFEDGFAVPMTFVAVDPATSLPLIGETMGTALDHGVVMSSTTAEMRGARPGDVVILEGWDGSVHQVPIAAILPDESLAWNELAFSDELAAAMGIDRPARAVLWGVNTTVVELLAQSVLGDAPIRVYGPGSERPPFQDWVLPMVQVKQRFGEFAFRETGTDRIETDDDWYEANIVTVTHPLLGQFRCHREILPYVEGALAELSAKGLVDEIDASDFQAAGGCYNARLARGGDLDRGFALSRHSWGIAIDFNPTTNGFGSEPSLSEAFGEVWRRWGFAWGAGWTVPDPMHFEWHADPVDPDRMTCVNRLAATRGGREFGDVPAGCPS